MYDQLRRWIAMEEGYAEDKFANQRPVHDEMLRSQGLDGFWLRQVVQYYDLASRFLEGAREARENGSLEDARHLELCAQQAMAKAMMTAKGLVESSIRVFGPLPRPGLASGIVEKWT